ncbi:MAG: flippase-like domain-containing protein, partial [Candidatus Aminicenantes bacterium]|nr:flippase-like domain-containing protein [Candidatus Aminicenantes bacterium]
FSQMLLALGRANYWYLLPVLAVIALSLVLRSLRWHYLLAPLQKVKIGGLFTSLTIGYMANTFLPAHLGEFVRAWHLQKKTGIAASSVFATIVMERLIDVFSLLLLLAVSLMVFPFPGWVQKSGGIMLALVAALSVLLLWMKKYQLKTMALSARLLRLLPASMAAKIKGLLEQFLNGVTALKRPAHYLAVGVLSLLIWVCYILTMQLLFIAFAFAVRYQLPWSAALVVTVVTTISVVVPSSPGYVGSFHYLCQLALGLFAIPKGPALSYAIVLHAVSIYPLFFLGLFFLFREKLSLKSLREENVHAFDH